MNKKIWLCGILVRWFDVFKKLCGQLRNIVLSIIHLTCGYVIFMQPWALCVGLLTFLLPPIFKEFKISDSESRD